MNENIECILIPHHFHDLLADAVDQKLFLKRLASKLYTILNSILSTVFLGEIRLVIFFSGLVFIH